MQYFDSVAIYNTDPENKRGGLFEGKDIFLNPLESAIMPPGMASLIMKQDLEVFQNSNDLNRGADEGWLTLNRERYEKALQDWGGGRAPEPALLTPAPPPQIPRHSDGQNNKVLSEGSGRAEAKVVDEFERAAFEEKVHYRLDQLSSRIGVVESELKTIKKIVEGKHKKKA